MIYKMKFLASTIMFLRDLTREWRRASCIVALLFLSAACAPAEKPYEAVWLDALHVKVTPIRDRDNAIFAILVIFTNRTEKDTALFSRSKDLTQSFNLSFSPLPSAKGEKPNAKLATIDLIPTLIDGPESDSDVTTSIGPSHTAIYCRKIEDYFLPNQTLHQKVKQQPHLKIFGSLLWKHDKDHLLPPHWVPYAPLRTDTKGLPMTDYAEVVRHHGPKFDLGVQEIMVHKNLSCSDAGK